MSMNRRSTALACRGINILASTLAARYGLHCVPLSAIRRAYDNPAPMPIQTRCRNGRLWVDRYYMAYALPDKVVHYVYLTKRHIHEEMVSYRAASQTRGRHIHPAAEILRDFRRARRDMAMSGRQIWIAPEMDKGELLGMK